MWYHEKIDFDQMSLDELIEFFEDKQFFMYNCNDPSWNRALCRIRGEYGEVRPNPQTGFGVIHGLRRTDTTRTSSVGGESL